VLELVLEGEAVAVDPGLGLPRPFKESWEPVLVLPVPLGDRPPGCYCETGAAPETVTPARRKSSRVDAVVSGATPTE
jgi:hypothetical protein